jgi:hypothetical protein
LKSSDNLKLDETSRLNFFLRIRQNKKWDVVCKINSWLNNVPGVKTAGNTIHVRTISQRQQVTDLEKRRPLVLEPTSIGRRPLLPRKLTYMQIIHVYEEAASPHYTAARHHKHHRGTSICQCCLWECVIFGKCTYAHIFVFHLIPFLIPLSGASVLREDHG